MQIFDYRLYLHCKRYYSKSDRISLLCNFSRSINAYIRIILQCGEVQLELVSQRVQIIVSVSAGISEDCIITETAKQLEAVGQC